MDLVGASVFVMEEIAYVTPPAAGFRLTPQAPFAYVPVYASGPAAGFRLVPQAPLVYAWQQGPRAEFRLVPQVPTVTGSMYVEGPRASFRLTPQVPTVTGSPIDPDFASVSLLLHMDGTNGSTTFTDSGPSGLTLTSVGGAQISTALSKFGGASGLFDGVDARVDLPSPITYSGPYTIEGWVYNSTGFGFDGIASGRGVTNGVVLRTDPDGKLQFLNPSLAEYSSTTALSLSTWHHVALTRNSSNVMTFWIDGIARGTVSGQSGDHVWGTVGAGEYGGFAAEHWPGHIDDMRWTAVCRYTSNFTPPTAPFPDS